MTKQINYADGIQINNSIDVDTRQGIVKFYYARFDSPDARGRVMHKNAFNRTVANNTDRIYHLNNHNQLTIIGKPLEFGKDNKGAWVVSKLSKNADGQKALALYEEGIYRFHSMGFYILNSEPLDDAEVKEIVREAKLVEVSTVLYPAHEQATTIALNSENAILQKLDEIARALSDRNSPPQSEQEVRNALELINNFKFY